MHYARIFSDDNGGSVFDDVALTALAEWPARTVRLQPVPPGLTSPLHPEPEPTLATVLSGWIEITNSGGELRRLAPGDVMLFADLTGQGHGFRAAPEGSLLMICRLQTGEPAKSTSDPTPPKM